MFGTYLRRELVNRRKQTVIIAIGMALAIALVIIVNAVSVGVKQAQTSVLKSVYGVGTDITITKAATASTSGNPGGPQFNFGANAGTESGSSRSISTSRLELTRGTTAIDASALDTVKKVDNVSSATAVLSLTNTSFSGTLPNFQQGQSGGTNGGTGSAPSGGSDGSGGSSFSVNSFSVMGISTSGASVGPLSSVTLSSGRTFTSADNGKNVAILDASYAKSTSTKVGGTITIGSDSFTVIGIVSATGSSSTTASNVYIPLDVAQSLSGETDNISTIYVTAASSNDISSIQTALEKALPGTTVSTEAELASTVSGSLGSASSLVQSLGTWLSLIVLGAAFLIAILFTISGVSRRTREFGTLKAIGWSNRRIVGQVAGESVVQGLIGGIIGVAAGLIGVLIVNLIAPTLSGGVSSSSSNNAGGPGGSGGGFGSSSPSGTGEGMRSGMGTIHRATEATSTIALHAPITFWIIIGAVALSILGGLVAGAIGGWRASRLRPAEALRSVA